MNGNKFTKTSWIILGIGFALAIIVIFSMAVNPDVGGACILAAVIFIVGLCIKRAIDNTACPKCGKKLSMKEISRKTTGSCATTMDVRREVKNSKGEVIRTYYEAVPATKYYYDCVDECKFCGHRRYVKREATYRD